MIHANVFVCGEKFVMCLFLLCRTEVCLCNLRHSVSKMRQIYFAACILIWAVAKVSRNGFAFTVFLAAGSNESKTAIGQRVDVCCSPFCCLMASAQHMETSLNTLFTVGHKKSL